MNEDNDNVNKQQTDEDMKSTEQIDTYMKNMKKSPKKNRYNDVQMQNAEMKKGMANAQSSKAKKQVLPPRVQKPECAMDKVIVTIFNKDEVRLNGATQKREIVLTTERFREFLRNSRGSKVEVCKT